MHDRDFWNSLSQLSDILYEIFQKIRFPEEDELPLLKKYVKHLWYSLHNIDDIMTWNKNSVGFIESNLEWFTPHLEFVDYLDIPEDDNGESEYIPMFEEAEILRR